ncbi:class I SAM-dependent DNA methyltransferase [uncultured Maricaulis sp.]|uniref:type I restriction-modification system subunit M n=1 Tax=uncultured Maricaulis sp. TaxID=174710 RepID=UPI0030DABE1E|tara:strand:+ start:36060 stop:38075 length:2016 start_codon:yes stop_codon:yes gene_type:complete
MTPTPSNVQSLANFAWSIAELLRGDFKQFEYGKVVLPFVVLRRLDLILEPTKDAVLAAHANLPEGIDDETRRTILLAAVGSDIKAYNTSRFTFAKLKQQDPGQLHANLVDYIMGFSPDVQDVFLEKFLLTDQLKRLNDAGLLWKVFERFTEIDLHPKTVSNIEMGYLFEELIRRFSEISNETAGEHFTPREVIRLIVDLLVETDTGKLTGLGVIRQVYDPACGTGGMLALAEEALHSINSKIRVELFGQELNPEAFAICRSDMLVTGHDPDQIAFGNTLTNDAHPGRKFHYMICNPPYGVDWKKYREPIEAEAKEMGHDGRFGAGTPRVSDGQLLFLQHMISKMRDDEAGSRVGIVMNGSPLFTGSAGGGESEIRRWMLENDWVEAIIALPTDLFYNTGIQTYVWLLSNRKPVERRGKVQLIDASGEGFWKSMRKSLGSKRREIPDEAREAIVNLYKAFDKADEKVSKVFDSTEFGYREIKVERPLKLAFQVTPKHLGALRDDKAFAKLPDAEQAALLAALDELPDTPWRSRPAFEKALGAVLKAHNIKLATAAKKSILTALSERDETAEICRTKDGTPEPDSDLRDTELVPLGEAWKSYLEREVTPFVADAWVDEGFTDASDKQVGRVGYEINFNRYFYEYVPPRPLAEIDAELKTLEAEIAALLAEVAA